MTYDEYIKSDAWFALRTEARVRAGYACELCGGPPDEVHHKKYPRDWKHDKLSNLIVLCRQCHGVEHNLCAPRENTCRYIGEIIPSVMLRIFEAAKGRADDKAESIGLTERGRSDDH